MVAGLPTGIETGAFMSSSRVIGFSSADRRRGRRARGSTYCECHLACARRFPQLQARDCRQARPVHEPLPTPLALKEISQELRAVLWRVLQAALYQDRDASPTQFGGASVISGKWERILKDWFVFRLYRFVDEFDKKYDSQEAAAKLIIEKGDYLQIFGFLQYVLRHQNCPYQFGAGIGWALRTTRAAYTVTDDGKTIAPVSNEGEANAVHKAFADLSQSEFGGAKAHLRNAAELLTEGKDNESIRESIHAVVSVARLLDPEANSRLSPALRRLEKEGMVHAQIIS